MRHPAALSALTLLFAVSACDQFSLSAPDDAAAPPAPPVEAPRDLVAETIGLGTVVYNGGIETINVPAELSVTAAPSGDYMVISGTLSSPSSAGRTNGASFSLPQDVEQAASGNLVRIRAVVSAASEGQAFLAYSTAEVGNSGWMPFQVSPEDRVVTFEYEVPEMIQGRGDYIGINPNGNTVTVKLITVEIAG